eukprot:TRINITY_DN691_c3_g1_i1.p1 TRINITY_DN691_c3_g1~~TRINITY_DN691_c3_g1_i1.p1  ORF type:complete len:1256 (+),score=233.89 TRINITY_DN691_c3_g1_i1:76-3843(+)
MARDKAALRISAKFVMVAATLVSTLISFGGGLVMYMEGLGIIEDTIKEISAAECQATARKLNGTFTTAYETSLSYASLVSTWTELEDLRKWQHFLERDQFARVRYSQDLYSAGLLNIPLTNTFYNRSAFAQLVWFDPLTEGLPEPGTRQYVSSTYFPEYYGHPSCMDPDEADPFNRVMRSRCNAVWELNSTGWPTNWVYNYTDWSINGFADNATHARWQDAQKGWQEHGATWWRSPDVWVSVDFTPYVYVGWMRVLPLQPPHRVLGGAGYKLVVSTFVVFGPWEDYLRAAAAEATLVATFLDEGLESQPLATNVGEKLLTRECGQSTFAQGKHPCLLTLRNVSGAIQEAAIKLNATESGRFIRSSIGGSDHWLRRLVIHPRGQHDEMYTTHLLWFRPVSSVEDKLNRSLYLFIGFVAAVFVFDMLILVFEIRKIARPLEIMKHSLLPLDHMDLDEAERHLEEGRLNDACMVVSEIENLVQRFKLTFDTLREYRRFLPEGVLVQPEPEDRGSSASSTSRDTRLSEASTTTKSRASKAEFGLDQSVVSLRFCVGDFRLKNATLLLATVKLGREARRSSTPDSGTSSLTGPASCVTELLDIAQQYGGINVSIMILDASLHVLFSWNALKPFPMHAVRGCSTALAMGRMTRRMRLECPVAVSSGRVQVGNVGNKRKRSQVIAGRPVQHGTWLVELAEATGANELCSQGVYEQARSSVCARVIDALSTPAGEVLVYELVDAEVCILDLHVNYVRGFAALRAGDCTEAQKEFREHLETHGPDRQAVRLFRIAQALDTREGHDRVLLRHQQPRWKSLEAAAEGIPLPDDVAAHDTLTVIDASVSAEDPVSRPARMEQNSPSNNAAQAEADMLKDQIREAYTSMAGTTMYADGSPSHFSDCPPSTFKDARGRQYQRSDKCLGRGAFGHVWLGLALDGSMVAVKSIKLRVPAGQLEGSNSENRAAPCMLGGTGEEDSTDDGWTVTPSNTGAAATGGWTVTDAEQSSSGGAPVTRQVSAGSVSQVPSFTTFTAPGQTIARRQVAEMLQEVALMISLRHENVVQFLGCAVRNAHVLIVMEYLPGGSLQTVLLQFCGKLPLSCVRRYTKDMVEGLSFIHRSKPSIVHRDLKPANVLLTIDGQCKLADFGASAELKQAAKGDGGEELPVGTPMYMPPEQTRGRASSASDIWSLGIVVCELCTGKCPWGDVGNQVAFMTRLGAKDSTMLPPIPEDIDEMARALIMICVQRDPSARPSARKLLNHPFLLS